MLLIWGKRGTFCEIKKNMSAIEERGWRAVKKWKDCGMKTQIYSTEHTNQPCWLSAEYNNQLEQKGLKRTLIFENSVRQSRDLEERLSEKESVEGSVFRFFTNKLSFLSGFHVRMCPT